MPATYELRPDVQAEFNANITDRKGVPFSLAAGIDMPVTCHAPLPGDDVVPVESAQLGMEDTLLFEIGHTSMTGSQMLFDQWVVPHLTTDAAGIAGAGLRPDGGAAADPSAADGRPRPSAGSTMRPAARTTLTWAPGRRRASSSQLEAGLTALGAMAVAPGSVEVTPRLPRRWTSRHHRARSTTATTGFRTVERRRPGRRVSG